MDIINSTLSLSKQSIEDMHSDEDTKSEISEISEIEEIKEIFEVKICSNNIDLNSDSDCTCDSECTYDSYDTFDTSDPDIFRKQEIKMEVLVGNKTLKSNDKGDFNILFKKMLDEFKKKTDKKVLRKIITSNNCDSDSSSEYYLHGYKFF